MENKFYADGILQECYDAGLDCAVNGANMTNCHFGIFSSPDKAEAWERGNKEGKR